MLVVLVAALPGCGDDGGGGADAGRPGQGSARGSTDEASPGPRFCDAYLDYLGESTPERLATVDRATDDPQVSGYAAVITSDADLDRVLAATLDLDDLAREQCQPEWTAGTQGAGDTDSAAQALFDAVVAGDRAGAQNVAATNAIAVFEPWAPVVADEAAGTPALAEVGGQSFTIVLGPADLAQCEVETGVVVACQRTTG